MEKIKDYWPFFTIYFIALGYLYSLGYYRVFNLNIFPYLDITDVFQIQFTLYNLLYLSLLVLILLIILIGSLSDDDKEANNIIKNNKIILLAKKLDGFLKIMFIIAIPWGLLAGAEFFGGIRGKDVFLEKPKTKTILVLEKSTIKTNENIIFIGQTKNYAFIYNRLIDQTTVYKIADIKEIKVRRISY